MITVRPDLDEWFDVIGIRVGDQKIKPEFNVTYVFQQSTWLIVMIVDINGEKNGTTEYSNSPNQLLFLLIKSNWFALLVE